MARYMPSSLFSIPVSFLNFCIRIDSKNTFLVLCLASAVEKSHIENRAW